MKVCDSDSKREEKPPPPPPAKPPPPAFTGIIQSRIHNTKQRHRPIDGRSQRVDIDAALRGIVTPRLRAMADYSAPRVDEESALSTWMRFYGNESSSHLESYRLQTMRREYGRGENSLDGQQPLSPRDIRCPPLQMFCDWLTDAVEHNALEPNACTLSTMDADGYPVGRTVLIKQVTSEGLHFYTNYTSDKSMQLEENGGKASATFWWPSRERQVRLRGVAEKLPEPQNDEYFEHRPWGSKVAAWASDQSSPVPTGSRLELERRYQDEVSKFSGQDSLPRPPHWGGYLLRVDKVEFWQGRSNRMHDRVLFTKRRGDEDMQLYRSVEPGDWPNNPFFHPVTQNPMPDEGGSLPTIGAATVVVLWSQITAFLTKLEAAAEPHPTPKRHRPELSSSAGSATAPKEAITSYREEEFPSFINDQPFSIEALHARICRGPLGQIQSSSEEDPILDEDPPERTLLNIFTRLEQLTLERSCSAIDDDTNSLREQDDASVLSSFYRTPIVSLLCHCLFSDHQASKKVDDDQISTEGEESTRGETDQHSSLLHDVFNSSLFNFCLDRLVEARNRYHAKAVMRSAQIMQPPPRKEIQSVRSSSLDETETYVKKCEKLQERLIVQKRARECELREQARARRNLRVQVSAQLHLFRELADLAVSPIQFVEADATDSSETDESIAVEPRLRPQLAVPSVPAELSAVLRDERVYSLQVKRAVESIVALKANQLDLVVANFTLEEIVRRHLKQSPPHRPLWLPPPPPHRPHHFRHRNYFAPPPPEVPWDTRTSSRFVRPFDLMSSSSSQHRHLHVSPLLRPLQSSPHLSSNEMADFPELRRPFVSSRLLEDSPPCLCPLPRWTQRREFDPVLESHHEDSNTSASPPAYFVHSREPTGSFGRPALKSKSFVESPLYPSLSAAPPEDLTPSQTLHPDKTAFKVSTPSKRGLKTVLGPGWQMVKKTVNQLTRGASNVNKQVKGPKPPIAPPDGAHSAALSRGQPLITQQPILEHTRGRTLQLCSPSPSPAALGGSASFVEQRRSISCGKRSATHNTTADGGESTSSLAGYA